jgi:hypothetical protein
MRVGHITTTSGKAERPFRCASCGYRALLQIVTIGEGTQSFLNSSGTAERRAQRDMAADGSRVASVATCPVCKFRDPVAVRRWWTPYVAWGVGGSAVIGIAAAWYAKASNMRPEDQSIAMWISLGLFLFMALGVLGTAWVKWAGIPSRVSFREDPSVAARYDAAEPADSD